MHAGRIVPAFFFAVLIINRGFSHGIKSKITARSLFGPRWIQNSHYHRDIRSIASGSNTNGEAEKDREPFLTLVEEMQNLTLQSGDRVLFRCKVDGYPMENVTYTWYKDNSKLIEGVDPRIRIRDKGWGSRLQISDVYSSDSGLYRCEVSNTLRRVYTSAYLKVSFNTLPDGGGTAIDEEFLKGKCEIYQGYACSEFLGGDHVYLESFQEQPVMEQQITQALKVIAGTTGVSSRCQNYAKAAFCYYVFPPCDAETVSSAKDPRAVRLCQEDCDLLKHDICRKEFFQQSSNAFISEIVNQADCSALPPTTTSNLRCTRLGLPSVINPQHKCYNDSGESYRGTLSVTENGDTCQPWPARMLFDHPELSGGHNFCRNPGGKREAPWCYTNAETMTKENCQVPLCNFNQGSNPDLVMILIPAVSVPLLLGCFVLIFCLTCKKKEKTVQHTKGIKMEKKALSAKRAKVPELSSNVVHVIGELGDGKFGKVFKAQILSNLHYCPNDPVAVKTLLERATAAQVHDFQMEMETFSALQHPNIACLKAVVVQPSLRCMIFEYTDGIDLHEHLVLHSPQSDFTKTPSSASSHASSIIDHADFIRMGIQIAVGMEYLTTHNFIHRDLAARNVLLCGNMDMKICNLGVVRDSYISSYYRSPQGGQMLPIRWMAPESLQSWQFSDKSAVWSFGVLLWEMYSYGLQPYCGYSNHEVLEMISRRQLLTCPDQCPAKMYSLINECWSPHAHLRPQFKDIHAKLVGWEDNNTTRMTSQLAQGIHRQLNSVMRDGSNGQYVQYNGTPHETMIGGVNGVNVPPNYPYPSPSGLYYPGMRSQNLNRIGFVGGATSDHNKNYNNQRQYQDSKLVIPSSRLETNYCLQNQDCPSYNSAQKRSNSSVISSENNRYLPHNVVSHPQNQECLEPNTPLQLSSAHQQQPGRDSRVLTEHRKLAIDENQSQPSKEKENSINGSNTTGETTDDITNARLLIPSHRILSDERALLPTYQGQKNNYEDESKNPSDLKPFLPSKPSAYVEGVSGDSSQAKPGTSDAHEIEKRQIRDAANRKATSCDSGLPCDDLDSEGTDSNRPLLPGKNSAILSPNKNPLLTRAASPSIAGYTQAT